MVITDLANDLIDQLVKIENECFSTPWSRKLFEDDLTNENAKFFIATENGNVLGYVGLYNVVGDGYITNVAVTKSSRRKGIATKLITALLKYSKANKLNFVTLEVRKSNSQAIALYNKLGFKQVGERKNYYTNPIENAVLMTMEGECF